MDTAGKATKLQSNISNLLRKEAYPAPLGTTATAMLAALAATGDKRSVTIQVRYCKVIITCFTISYFNKKLAPY